MVTAQTPEDYIAHFGVKGMKWGVRKNADVVLSRNLKGGGKLVVTKEPPSGLAKLIGKVSSTSKAYQEKSHFFSLSDKDGNKVGEANFYQDSPTSLNLVWLGVNKKHRGNGYGSAAISGVVKFAQDKGLEKLTLEVPGNAPDARHIYEKYGFKETRKEVNYDEDDFWGGLTVMELNVPKPVLKHGKLDLNEVYDYIVNSINETPEDTLVHYGIKGMKWGKRKARGSSKSSGSKKYSNKAEAFDTVTLGPGMAAGVRNRVAKGETVKSARLKEAGKTVAISAAIIGGTVAAAHLMSKHSNRRVSSLSNPQNRTTMTDPSDLLRARSPYVPKRPGTSNGNSARSPYVPKRPGTTRPTNISPTAFQTKLSDVLKADTVQVRKIQTEIGKIQKSGSPLSPNTLNLILKASQRGQADNGAQIIKTLQNYRYFTE